ncbi:MAG: hypothetical protein KDI82_10930 [Gammaproteobacteria bacterium]|nr:hypothetical protein [Gammaproteobacteria bacterium]
MNKTALILMSAVFAVQPFAVAAEDNSGPIELNEMGLDAVTAGSISVPPSAAVSVLSDASGDFAITSTSSSTYIQNSPVSLMFGYAPAWVTAVGGTATATSTGATADRSTSIGTTPEIATAAAINPYAATINWTRKILGTEISAFAQVAPGGPLLDFFHYRRSTIRW